MTRQWYIHQDSYIYIKIRIYTSRFVYIHQDSYIHIKIRIYTSRFVYIHQDLYLLYGSVSQGLGTTKFKNLIGWNGYWPRSRFSHLDRRLDRRRFEVKKLQGKMQNHWLFSSENIYFCKVPKSWWGKKKENRTRKLWKN